MTEIKVISNVLEFRIGHVLAKMHCNFSRLIPLLGLFDYLGK